MRSKEESLWAVHVLRKIGEKLTAEDRHSGVQLKPELRFSIGPMELMVLNVHTLIEILKKHHPCCCLAKEGQANKSRRRSSVEQSFKGFGDVVFAAQLARN